MLPLTPTHALALARSEELQRMAQGAHPVAAAPARHGHIASTLLALAHDARRQIAGAAKAASRRPASTSSTPLCCA